MTHLETFALLSVIATGIAIWCGIKVAQARDGLRSFRDADQGEME